MIDLKPTAILLFLVPGLCAYLALYHVFVSIGFRNRAKLTPTPPEANSIKTVTLILLWSLATHAVTSIVIATAAALRCANPLVTLPHWLIADPYAAFPAKDATIDAAALAQLLLGALAQGGVTIFVIQHWLRRRAATNTLPEWLFGWTARIANLVDDDDKLVVFWVLTDTDVAGKTLAYSGQLRDLSIMSDGTIVAISLDSCERYAVDLTTPHFAADLEPLSRFEDVTIEGARIRDVATKVAELPPE